MTDDAQASTHPPHILVVDDDPALRELLQGYLGEADMRVSAVDSGRRLFEVFDQEAIDLVVLDLRLPGEDGLALARQLRERAPVPVVLLTGRAEEADRVIAAIVDQIRAMHRGDFSDEEVAGVRQYLAGAALFDLQTVEQRAERLVELERLGLPLDEPKTWPDRIATITPRQVRAAARVHLHPDALFRVALGPLAKSPRSRIGESRKSH